MSPKDSQPQVRPMESPNGLDLYPRPPRAVRISRRTGFGVIAIVVALLLAFAYGGYRRSVKVEAAAKSAGLPKAVAPATQAGAEFVKEIPLGAAPLEKSGELQPPPAAESIAAAPCGNDPRTGTPYRFDPHTGRRCGGPRQSVPAMHRTPHVAQAVQHEPPRQPTPAERASTGLPARTGGPTGANNHLDLARSVGRGADSVRRRAGSRRF